MKQVLDITATVVGVAAVVLYGLGYWQKDRRKIVLIGAISRVLYVAQYLLLGELSGAIMDVISATGAIFAGRRHVGFLKKLPWLVPTAIVTATLAAGIPLFLRSGNVFDLFPVAGVILQTVALCLTKEKHIRLLSLAGSPFWMIYNIQAGSVAVVGDIWCMTALSVSIIRYDVIAPLREKRKHKRAR